MKLNSEFYRLPLTFDVEKLTQEVNSFNESDWLPHPTGYQGNSSIPLISVNGESNDDFAGPMQITTSLKKCPYIKQVISSFGEVFGRSRLMRLGPGYEVPEHSDINYHWYSRVRIHIPIITYPEVKFYCGDKNVHMEAGETWIFDSWEMHKVINGATKNRVHLVIDTCGSHKFWQMVNNSDEPHNNILHSDKKPKFLAFDAKAKSPIQTEKYNVSIVMSAGEVDAHCMDLIQEASNPSNDATELLKYIDCVNEYRFNWRTTFSLHGLTEKGWPIYQSLLEKAQQQLSSIRPIKLKSNGSDARQVFNARVLNSCFNPATSKASAQTKNSDAKPGRNSPCPCGSGKKYKRCCQTG